MSSWDRPVKGDQSTIRALNRKLILRHLRQRGPLSRVKLAELTGLSGTAVTSVTAELIGQGFVVEGAFGAAGATGGRRPVLLDIDYKARWAVGLKLIEDRLEAVLTDLSTRVVDQLGVALENHTPELVARRAAEVSAALLDRNGIESEYLVGIGLGLSGLVDADAGLCRHSPILGWRNVPIAALIAEHSGASVWVDNDVKALAAAERLFGHARDTQNFVVITVGRGVGAAIVVDGALYRGRRGGAGEFGHTLSELGGRRCECGNVGCLEAYASEPSVMRRLAERDPMRAGLGVEDLVRLAERRDAVALELLADAGARVGRNLADLVNLLSPELIVVGGEGTRLGEPFFGPMRRAVSEHAFDGLADDLPIVVDNWAEALWTPWARGAASLAVQHALGAGAL